MQTPATRTHQQVTTPVVLIIFNRPDSTRQVFEQIRRVQPSKLFVIADGPRVGHPTDQERSAASRDVVAQVDWSCEVLTNFAEANMGCEARISSGLDWVFEQVETAIILEDDCVPEPDFFVFCETLLTRYGDDERVMMISGSNMVDKVTISESYLFSRWYNIWGWATWRRAWQRYDRSMTDWPSVKSSRLVEYVYPTGYVSRYLRHSFDLAYAHEIDSWGIRWFYTCLRSSGLCVVPQVNLIANIGVVGTHTQRGQGGPLATKPLDTDQLRHPSWVHANSEYDNALFAARLKPRWRTFYYRTVDAILLRVRRLLVN